MHRNVGHAIFEVFSNDAALEIKLFVTLFLSRTNKFQLVLGDTRLFVLLDEARWSNGNFSIDSRSPNSQLLTCRLLNKLSSLADYLSKPSKDLN